jgi:SAM-dependent methyltransferase
MWLIISFLVFGLGILGTLALGGYLAAPWVPLWRRDVGRMLRLANVKPGELVYDLGAGDGRILMAAARDFQARAIGYEIAILPYLIGRSILWSRGLHKRAQLRYGNFFTESLADADVVTAFLSRHAMEKLRSKFEQELKPGSRVVTCVFSIPGWEPTITDKAGPKQPTVYVYQR